jgi:hypothetical protein
VATQPGGAYDDVVGLALFLAAVAVLLNSQVLSNRSQRAAWVMAAASLGLAIGVKWTFVGPAVALIVGALFIVRRGKRIRTLGLWLVVVLLTGAFWYARNLIAVGNPIPPLHLRFGPISLPSPQLTLPSRALTHLLFNTADWRIYFLPGLRLSFGPAWWALLGLSALGLVLAVVTGDRLLRILGVVGLVSGILFVFTPQYLAPLQFAENARYGDAAVILGLVVLPINPLLSPWRRARWVLLAYMAILAVTQLDAGIWPTTIFSQRFIGGPVRGSDSLIGLLIGVAVLVVGAAIYLERDRLSRWPKHRLVYVVIVAAVVFAGFPLQQTYLRDRYTSPDRESSANWFQHENNLRVGVIGDFADLQYPFYGKNLSNYVQYLGVRGPHGTYSAFVSCRQWRQAIVSGRFSYVYITTNVASSKAGVTAASIPEMRWTAGRGGANVVLSGQIRTAPPFPGYLGYTLFKVDSRFSSDGCQDSTRT